MYLEVLVCYDIADNKRRRKLVKELKDLGLLNVQESVFWGRIVYAEFKAVRNLFEKLLKKEEDKAFLIRCDLSKQVGNQSFGYPDKSMFEEKEYEII